MGASQSTRKLTLVNDDKSGVIKLSESLAYRLRGQIEGQRQQTAAETPEPAAASSTPAPASPFPPSKPVAPSDVTPLVPRVPEAPKIPVIASLEPSVVESEPVSVESPLAPESAVREPSPASAPEPKATAPKAAEPAPEASSVPLFDTIIASPTASVPVSIPELMASGDQPGEPSAASYAAVAPPAGESSPDIGVAIKAGPGPTLAQPGGNIPPWSIYAEEAHLMVMRLREEKEQEIKKLNLQWRDKMESREEEFKKMARLSEEEVSSSTKEVEKLFLKASCNPVCQDHQEAVVTCYQDHPHQSLRCARQVDNFAQCVDLSRLQSVMKQQTAQ